MYVYSIGATTCFFLFVGTAMAADSGGLQGQWNFDEGQVATVIDSSGNDRQAMIHGGQYIKQGKGFALYLDGVDDYMDCGQIDTTNAISLELWVRPLRKAHGEASLVGTGMQSYQLTYYNTELACWYIGDGSNGVNSQVKLKQWNHVVGTFDGKTTSLWINGRQASTKQSKFQEYQAPGRLHIGMKGRPDLPHFKGLVDRVRVYSQALTQEQILAHFKGEASEYGFDPAWFERPTVRPYYYFDRDEIVVEADCRGLLSRDGTGQLAVELLSANNPALVLRRQEVGSISALGITDITVSIRDLPCGQYLLRVWFQDSSGPRSSDEFSFSYPPSPSSLPAPVDVVAGPLPLGTATSRFRFRQGHGGGFEVIANGSRYQFESRISWPNGDFNHLTVKGNPIGEKIWRVRSQQLDKNHYTVTAQGAFYTLDRDVTIFPTHVYVKDTFSNTTTQDIGLLIHNQIPLGANPITESRISGFERRGRQLKLSHPDYGPSIFFADNNVGFGIVPVDDVYVVQAEPYVLEEVAGIATEKFALPAGKRYTLEWAVYPVTSRDYYDFINAFRTVEGRIATIDDVQAFIGRRAVPPRGQVERLGMKVAIIPSISNARDDPNLYIEGVEFVDFPQEMDFLKQQVAGIKKKYPGMKVVLHIAHSLYCTNAPDRFSDSKVIAADNTQASWGDGTDFGLQRKSEGWRWWIFYPTPGNSFHQAMLESVDVMMDYIGLDGGFMDGFLAGYQGQWSYDTDLRWDGHSAEIDPQTKTIRRKINSVLLLSQPSMIAYARKIRDKGGVVLANNCVFTRSIANEKYITFNNECASGPQLHLAPSVMALAQAWGPALRSERDVYLDMLDKLSWGELWFSYGEPFERFSGEGSPTLAGVQFPMTFEQIRPGMVRGPERIVTMVPGVYGWPESRQLHQVYKFDDRGGAVQHEFITTVNAAEARTELVLDRNESAVIEPIPVILQTVSEVNARVMQYDSDGLRVELNGQGPAHLHLASGLFPVKPGAGYRLTIGPKMTTRANADERISIRLDLAGRMEVAIEPILPVP